MMERMPLRRRVNVSTTLGLTAVWIMLWGSINLGTAVFGLLAALVVQLTFPLPEVEELEHFRPISFLILAAHTVQGLLTASVSVAVKVLAFRRPTRNAMIRVPLRTSSQFVSSITAELTTLVPGSIVIDSDDHGLLVHVFDASSPAAIEKARLGVQLTEARVIRAFGSNEERRALAEEGRAP
ncbi:Na+/H+ antiporter subunit E [Aestuariimicrobium soli]|uniref:Na+/H+ antiporter subunit E n=1 Tax=Aestuariimicrobium soli TaxID=2035834 RepID=UPI003EBCE556